MHALLMPAAVAAVPPDNSIKTIKKRRRRKRPKKATAKLLLSNMNSQSPKNEPDPDAIKMFVGQIPRSMDENDLRKMFEEFGVIFQLNVLRDKITGQSKGCCFVTFNTRRAALEAQNALHNIKTLPGMQHPIQMKPADSEKRNVEERKLFVGMLSKKCNETDIRMMFAPFGTIEECTVLREQNGQSKGCAFVTYANKQCAQNAIKAMHQSQTMEGCRAPLVVKFADTQKEKELKKLQQANANLMSASGMSGIGSLTPQYIALLQQAAAAGNLGAFGNLGTGLNNLQMQQLLTAAAAAAVGNSPGLAALAGLNSTNLQSNANTSTTGSATSSSTTAGESGNLQNLQNLQGLAALASMTNNPTGSIQNLAAINQLAAAAANPASAATGMPGIATTGTLQHYSQGTNSVASNTGSTNTTNSGGLSGLQASPQLSSVVNPAMASSINGIGNAAAAQMSSSQTSMDALSQAYTGIQQYAGLSGLLNQASFPNAFAAQTAAQLQQAAANSPAGKVTEGPEGANLFIYHLPQEFSDQDLLQTFLPFGTVISAKVFIDKQTNLSKCFGFVSYDNQVSAHSAIQAMNGFQIGMKRLKVQLKRPKHENKPY